MLLHAKYQRYAFSQVLKNFVNGEFVKTKCQGKYPVRNPVTQ
jgi:hypothetical protein